MKPGKSMFRRLIAFAGPYRGRVWLAVFFSVVFALSSGATLGMILPLFDDVLTRRDSSGTAPDLSDVIRDEAGASWNGFVRDVSSGNPAGAAANLSDAGKALRNGLRMADPNQSLVAVIAVVVGLILMKNLAAFLQAFHLTMVEERMLEDLRRGIYDHILKLHLGFFTGSRTGELTTLLTADVMRIKGAVTQSLVNALKEAVLLVVFLVLALLASWRLTMVALLVFPPGMILVNSLARKLRKSTHRSQERMADFASVLQESMLGIRVVKAFGMEDFELRRFVDASADHRRHELRLRRVKALSGPLTELLGALISATVLWYGGREVIQGGGMSAGRFLVFLAAALSMMDPVKALSKAWAGIQEGLASADRLFRLMDTRPMITEPASPVKLSSFEDGIRFEHVSFSYLPGIKVLKDIDLTVRKGEMVALVGPSGGGKSTLADMIPRFHDPTSGRVTIDGVDLRTVETASLRKLLGMVTQDTILFNDTVRNNIAYGNPGIPLAEVAAAAATANALEFIEKLPKGFDTIIGERGATLSGGQKQRLAIARAILRNPPILVFDEATSSLDTRSEKLVQKAVEGLVAGRTSVVTAHRLSTIRKADRVIYIEDGRILEEGTHEALLALGGRYRSLYELQFSED
jgi:subfamily B ATP-binding cassette protein MsbA